jgi:hypothetical protein
MNKLTRYAVALMLIGAIVSPGISLAQSTSQLQAQINALLAQLQVLQQELAAAQGGSSTAWCHIFNTNLGVGSTGSEVVALQTALQKENIMETGPENGTYDETTASFVTAFQEKYSSDILTPVGLTNGTGYVGPATRTKLNGLYGCGTNPSTQPIQPTTTTVPMPTAQSAIPYIFSAQASPGGLIISGNFGSSGNQVWIDGTIPTITYQSTSEIIASLAGISPGTHLVSVGYAGLGSAPLSFTVTSAEASTSTTPTAPSPITPHVSSTQVSGSNLSLLGTFGPSNNQVSIDGIVVPITSQNNSQIVISSAGLSIGTHSVTVGYMSLSSVPFSFTTPASLSGVEGYNSATGVYTNGSVIVGTYLVLYGNFGSSGNIVTLDGSAIPASALAYQSMSQINISLANLDIVPTVLFGPSHIVLVTTRSGSTNPLSFVAVASGGQ